MTRSRRGAQPGDLPGGVQALAAEQTIGLSADAYVALVQALGIVSRDPFDETTTLATPDVHVRRVVFGGAGMASVYIDPVAGLISVFAVVWAG